MERTETASLNLRWREVYSLAALSAAVAISWIAYHEYQPFLLEKFNLGRLSVFLIIAKGIVLVLVPPLAGWLSDYLLQRTGRFFMVFSVGIGITAMTFMVVASIMGAGPLSRIQGALPLMIVIWLIAMNMFTSPALSMIDSFSPTQKLPLVVGFLFFVTQLIYALEPLIVEFVQFFGDTMTFTIGGILIAGTGYVFHRVSSGEVVQHRKGLMAQAEKPVSTMDLVSILAVGFVLGVGNAFLVEFVPVKVVSFAATSRFGGYLSFALLGFSALIAFAASGYVARRGFRKVLPISMISLVVALLLLLWAPTMMTFIIAGALLAVAFGLVNVSGLPYAISKLSVRNITFGVGVFIGASYITEGILEYMYK